MQPASATASRPGPRPTQHAIATPAAISTTARSTAMRSSTAPLGIGRVGRSRASTLRSNTSLNTMPARYRQPDAATITQAPFGTATPRPTSMMSPANESANAVNTFGGRSSVNNPDMDIDEKLTPPSVTGQALRRTASRRCRALHRNNFGSKCQKSPRSAQVWSILECRGLTMTYLNGPRLHFAGSFNVDVSTVNNFVTHFRDPNDPDEPGWNPAGSARWKLVDCKVTRAVHQDGTIAQTAADHPVIGLALNQIDRAVMVDLDP